MEITGIKRGDLVAATYHGRYGKARTVGHFVSLTDKGEVINLHLGDGSKVRLPAHAMTIVTVAEAVELPSRK